MRLFFTLFVLSACAEPHDEPTPIFETLPLPSVPGYDMTFVFDDDGLPVAAGYDNRGPEREYFVHRFDGTAWTTMQVDASSDVWAHPSVSGQVLLTVNNTDIWRLERDGTWTMLPPHTDGRFVFGPTAGPDGTIYRGTDSLFRLTPNATAWETVDALPCSYYGREMLVEPDNTLWRARCAGRVARTRDGETMYAALDTNRLVRGADGMYSHDGVRVLRVDRESLDVVVVLEVPFDEAVEDVFDNGDGAVFATIREADYSKRVDRLDPDGVVTIATERDFVARFAASGATLYKYGGDSGFGRLVME